MVARSRHAALGLLLACAAPVHASLDGSEVEAISNLDFGAALLRMVISLVVVIAIMIVALKLLQRMLRARGTVPGGRGDLRVVDHVRLEPGRSVHLVRIGDRFFLIGAAEGGVSLIADDTLDQDALRVTYADDAGAPAPGKFAGVLRSAARRRDVTAGTPDPGGTTS